jgi:SAM-dependent methyltransferase
MYLYTEILELSPKLKRFFWHTLYQYLARFQNPEWKFMNYGYADSKNIYLHSTLDEENRYFIQLYDRVVAGTPIENKTILEVGSGRGGGLDYINRYYKPSLATGIDLSENAIEFCKQNYRGGISFERGDALNINYPSESLDVVINVESSHCYPSLTKFFQEVYRVLKPNGYFLYADLCKASNIVEKSRKN